MHDLAGLRVCFVAGTLGQGGAERQLFYILRALRECGANARVLSLTQGEHWEPHLRQVGTLVRWVGGRGGKLGRLVRIVRELARNPVDIVQSQHFYVNLYACGAARLLGIPGVGAIRNTVQSEVRALGRIAGGSSLRMPRLLAANSRAAIRDATAMGVPGSRLCLLPNVVDTDQFQPSDRPVGFPIRLVAIGRLVPQKRFDRFLNLMARLRRETGRHVVGRIVGSGPLREELWRRAADQGLLPDGLEFSDAVPGPEDVYGLADILVLTSDAEGTPNVVLEAMASGLPVVAARVGGVEEIIEHGETGYLVDSGDEDRFYQALLELVESRGLRLRLGRNARESILGSHSLQRLPVALADLYARATA